MRENVYETLDTSTIHSQMYPPSFFKILIVIYNTYLFYLQDRVKDAVATHFNIDVTKLYLSYPTFFSELTAVPPQEFKLYISWGSVFEGYGRAEK